MRSTTLPRCAFFTVGAMALAGCLNTVTLDVRPDAATDAAVAADATVAPDIVAPVDVTSTRDASRDAVFPTVDDGAVAQPERCGEEVCAVGEACCLGTGRCFDPVAHADLCPRPAPNGNDPTCASHDQCAADQYCVTASGTACFGTGHCQPRDSCPSCMGSAAVCAVCGCDGRTYPDPQTACHAGVRVAGAGACGVAPVVVTVPDGGPRTDPVRIACAYNAQCPSGQSCCPLLGVCVDAACATCCRVAPAGTDFPCERDEQCYPSQYCAGEGCETPGGCTYVRGTGECSGVVTQACGCDGRSYINACWATGVGVRVASTGACP